MSRRTISPPAITHTPLVIDPETQLAIMQLMDPIVAARYQLVNGEIVKTPLFGGPPLATAQAPTTVRGKKPLRGALNVPSAVRPAATAPPPPPPPEVDADTIAPVEKPLKVVIAPPLCDLPSRRWVATSVPEGASMRVDISFATKFFIQLCGYSKHRLNTLEGWLKENPTTHPFYAGCTSLKAALTHTYVRASPETTLTNLEDALNDPINGLSSIIGRETVKRNIYATLKAFAQSWRTFEGFTNTLLYGGPGTGKTSLARLLAWVYGKAGLLATTTYEVCTGGDLVGQYVGQSVPKTREVYARSLGGVLLIDEAYQVRGEKSPFGDEVIAELVNLMDKLPYVMVIAAGYKDRIQTQFLDTNAGLRRRFVTNIELEPFKAIEIAEMCVADLDKRVTLRLSDRAVIRDLIVGVGSEAFSGQAGDAMNLAKLISQELLSREVPLEEMRRNQRSSVIAGAFERFFNERA